MGHPSRVVIVGGGFAGLTLAQRLERLLPASVEIALPPADVPLSDVMRTTPPTVTEAQPLRDALGVLLREEIEALPVLAADGSRRIVGMLDALEVFRRAAGLSDHVPARRPAADAPRPGPSPISAP